MPKTLQHVRRMHRSRRRPSRLRPLGRAALAGGRMSGYACRRSQRATWASRLAYYYPGDHASASTARRKEQRIRQFDRWLSKGRPAADRPTVRDPRLKPGEHHPTFEDDPTYAYVAPEAAASDQRPAAAAARGRSRSQDVRAHMGRPSSAWPSSRLWQ